MVAILNDIGTDVACVGVSNLHARHSKLSRNSLRFWKLTYSREPRF
jgi:hypothetical protein